MINLSRRMWIAVVLAMGIYSPAGRAQSLDAVRKAGTINIGVKADSKPWAYLDPTGKSVGWEIDLAQAIAAKLGVEAKLTTVTSANRIQFLEQGMVDMLIATMSDTPERRRVVHMIEPPYFADATNLLATEASPIKKWNDVKGRKICGVQGSIYNRPLQQKYGAEVVAFGGLTESLSAVQSGACEGVVYADQVLRETAGSPDWKGYIVKLEPIDETPWAMAIRKGEADSELAKTLSQIVADWHRTGYFVETAKKWRLESNPFLIRRSKTGG